MELKETKIAKIEDYTYSKFNTYRHSDKLTNPIIKREFIVNVKTKEHKFGVSDLFN